MHEDLISRADWTQIDHNNNTMIIAAQSAIEVKDRLIPPWGSTSAQ